MDGQKINNLMKTEVYMDYEPEEDREQEEEEFLIDKEDFYDLLMEQQEQM